MSKAIQGATMLGGVKSYFNLFLEKRELCI